MEEESNEAVPNEGLPINAVEVGIEDVPPSMETADQLQSTLESLQSWGWFIFGKLQDAGEVVANVIGLNNSKFQYVLDSMTEEDWKIARAVQAQREQQIADRATGAAAMEGGAVPVAECTQEAAVER